MSFLSHEEVHTEIEERNPPIGMQDSDAKCALIVRVQSVFSKFPTESSHHFVRNGFESELAKRLGTNHPSHGRYNCCSSRSGSLLSYIS
jgi:hypothetical protein